MSLHQRLLSRVMLGFTEGPSRRETLEVFRFLKCLSTLEGPAESLHFPRRVEGFGDLETRGNHSENSVQRRVKRIDCLI